MRPTKEIEGELRASKRRVKYGIVKGCLCIFDKIKHYLRDLVNVNVIGDLYRQPKGIREALEHLVNTEAHPIHAETIAMFTNYEKEYTEKADLMDATELTKAELVVPLVIDGVSMEEQASANPFVNLKMPTLVSRPPTEPLVPVDSSSTQLAAWATQNP